MVIIGTGGIATDIIGGLALDFGDREFFFYNDRSDCTDELFVDRYRIIHSADELKEHFKTEGPEFVVAIGNPVQRFRMANKIKKLGGVLTRIIFKNSQSAVSPFSVIGDGSIVLVNVCISSAVEIGEGGFINSHCVIGHDAVIGQYCSFGPGCRILGAAEIGELSYIGCNTVILPNVKIGKKVRIGIGKIIDQDIPDNSKVM